MYLKNDSEAFRLEDEAFKFFCIPSKLMLQLNVS